MLLNVPQYAGQLPPQRMIQSQMLIVLRKREALLQTKGLSPLSPPALAEVKETRSLFAVKSELDPDKCTLFRNSVPWISIGRQGTME